MSANEIIPNLFLGDITASQSQDFIENMKINVVVNCSKNIPFLKGGKYKKIRVPVHDNLQEEEIANMTRWSASIIRQLWDEYSKGSTILVHCHAGMQRSAAVVAMFLIFYQRYTHKEAIEYIQKRRPIAFQPRPNFFKSIVYFESALNDTLRKKIEAETE